MSNKNQQAIVLGGSISGLLTARVLADHFARVIVIERDLLPTDHSFRKGAPQARHLHVLLARGEQIMTKLLPGLGDRLDQAGAPTFDLGEEAFAAIGGKVVAMQTSGVLSRSISRVRLEAEVRSMVKQIANIEFREQTEVLRLLGNYDQSKVVGVAVRQRGSGHGVQEISADFVVDATGRRSKAPIWLEKMGYAQPEETIINATVGYATRVFQPRDGFNPDWRVVAIPPEYPYKTRGGGIQRQEDGTVIMTLLGTAGDLPPTDEASFIEFAGDVHPIFVETLNQCDPITSIVGYRKLENQWRRFDKLERMPDRFAVIGDAFCAFNPIYGQGMSAAAMEAVQLGDFLTKAQGDLDGVAQRFIRSMPSVVSSAWMLATGEDLRWPTTTGEPDSFMVRMAPWLSAKIQLSLPYSPEVFQAFVEVQNLLKGSERFFRPWTFAAILWHSWRAQRQAQHHTAQHRARREETRFA